MTREDAKNFLIKLGIAEPTNEQVSDYLNTFNGEIQKEKTRVRELQEKADKTDELQKQLDALNESNMTEIERVSKELERIKEENSQLKHSKLIAERRSNVAEKWQISPDEAKTVIKDDGSIDDDVLGRIISNKVIKAAELKEQEIAKGSINPKGGAENDETAKSPEVVQSIAKSFSSDKSTEAIIGNYL